MGKISWGDIATDVVGLGVTLIVSFELSRRLFRWEPEAKVSARAKFWVLAAFIPFFLFGTYENAYGHLLNRVEQNFRLLSVGSDASGDPGVDHPAQPPPQLSTPN